MRILAGSSNIPLTRAISTQLMAHNVTRIIRKFPDGELSVRLLDSVKGETVVIVQSLQAPIHDHLMEFLLLADAVKRAGATHSIGVIPYLAYARQNKVFQPGEPLSAAIIGKALSGASIEKLFVLDVHDPNVLDFFSVPMIHLSLVDEFAHTLRPNFTPHSIVVAPDAGGVVRSEKCAKLLGAQLVKISKERNRKTGEVTVKGVSGSVRGKECVVLDDMIATGSTVVTDALYLKSQGAQKVTFCATHGIFLNGFMQFEGIVDKLIVSDTISLSAEAPPFVQVVSAARTIAHALKE